MYIGIRGLVGCRKRFRNSWLKIIKERGKNEGSSWGINTLKEGGHRRDPAWLWAVATLEARGHGT